MSKVKVRLGIVAVQGAFVEHRRVFERLGAECVEIRNSRLLDECDGLVLPGGESTTQGKLARELSLFEPVRAAILRGVPTFATCAGLILLAERIVDDSARYFATIPCVARRNAFGRQNASFTTALDVRGIGAFPCVFIRAPYLESVGKDVEILATYCDRVVGVRYRNQWGFAFHPELTDDDRLASQYLADVVSYAARIRS